MSSTFIKLPTLSELGDILRKHPLTPNPGKLLDGFLVGSFAAQKAGDHSDVDVLFRVAPKAGMTAEDYTEFYRRPLRAWFMCHDIRGKCDKIHPQWEGRRLDIYFTYDERSPEDLRQSLRLQKKPGREPPLNSG